ncbi:hypothetical protein EAS64_01845 [Trebonia kvetii]|uniref:Uncharacterized protein n=1 Tax=Trebonia kvetii TaxID=2480626 RepID=A0A6P2C467_9ACTN|nr:hypothetical protein [Trebonia kvetii]TVZ06209.1 hypothetical protein EAS64_01845 [Trebonia kvetii]
MASATPGSKSSPTVASAARRVPVAQRMLADFLAVLALSLAGAHFGLWFVPFVLGAVVSAFRPRARAYVLVVAAGAAAGWALALWLMALDGLPVGATARTISALAGLPPYAAVVVAVTLLLAVLQALAGIWLARAVFPRQVRLPFPGRHPQP